MNKYLAVYPQLIHNNKSMFFFCLIIIFLSVKSIKEKNTDNIKNNKYISPHK